MDYPKERYARGEGGGGAEAETGAMTVRGTHRYRGRDWRGGGGRAQRQGRLLYKGLTGTEVGIGEGEKWATRERGGVEGGAIGG